eukprot:4819572-Prymnesium_polylepis.1
MVSLLSGCGHAASVGGSHELRGECSRMGGLVCASGRLWAWGMRNEPSLRSLGWGSRVRLLVSACGPDTRLRDGARSVVEFGFGCVRPCEVSRSVRWRSMCGVQCLECSAPGIARCRTGSVIIHLPPYNPSKDKLLWTCCTWTNNRTRHACWSAL